MSSVSLDLTNCPTLNSVFANIFSLLSGDFKNFLVSLEVRLGCSIPVGHPHTLALARNRLVSAHIGEDDVTVEVLTVHILGRSVKAGSTAHNTLPLLLLSLLPSVYEVFVYHSIKGDNHELGVLGQRLKLRKEGFKHLIRYGARLVDADGDPCSPVGTLTGVNVGETLVDALHGRAASSFLARLHEGA